MRYKYISKTKLKKMTPSYEIIEKNYLYANEEDKEYKELIIEQEPEYNKETQKLIKYFVDGVVITQKYKIVEKEIEKYEN